MEPKRYVPQPRPLPEKPRRVRGGLKISATTWPPSLSWAATRWVNAVAKAATPDSLQQGIDYARQGQTRTLAIEPGRVAAEVQGRAFRPLRATIEFTKFTDDQWHRIESAMTDQAVYAAKLLAHEVPENIDELFSPLHLSLYPADAAFNAPRPSTDPPSTSPDLRVSCTCNHPDPWCKHAVCAALLLGERLDKNPFLIFNLRGLPGEELIERLRARRAAAQGTGDMFTQSLSQRLNELGFRHAETTTPIPAGHDHPPDEDGTASNFPQLRPINAPLEHCLDTFWELGPGLEELDTPLRPPEVSHALLRRLGPSPFKEGKFPLVGLLATCYETISRSALDTPSIETPAPNAASGNLD